MKQLRETLDAYTRRSTILFFKINPSRISMRRNMYYIKFLGRNSKLKIFHCGRIQANYIGIDSPLIERSVYLAKFSIGLETVRLIYGRWDYEEDTDLGRANSKGLAQSCCVGQARFLGLISGSPPAGTYNYDITRAAQKRLPTSQASSMQLRLVDRQRRWALRS
jgi:hypothetical protein